MSHEAFVTLLLHDRPILVPNEALKQASAFTYNNPENSFVLAAKDWLAKQDDTVSMAMLAAVYLCLANGIFTIEDLADVSPSTSINRVFAGV